MEDYRIFPNATVSADGPLSRRFQALGIETFYEACRHVHRLPYGYNSNRDDPGALFTEGFGSCTTKHAVIAGLAGELGLPVFKNIGIYAMTEALVTGTGAILERHRIPWLPMVHCFLVYGKHRVDLTAGNRNGKNGPVDTFLHTEKVPADVSAREEYRRYRVALQRRVLPLPAFRGTGMKTILRARAEGIVLLRANIGG